MEIQTQNTAEEIKRLQRCINDLVSVLALPAMWLGYDSSQIATTLLEVLLRMLHLDFAYVRVRDSLEGSWTEWARSAERHRIKPDEIGRALDHSLTNDTLTETLVMPSPIGEGVVSLALFRLGLRGELGSLVAASHRADFPTAIEQLLLQVAANQAAIGLQEARYRRQQRRATEELEQRVVERTAELACVNEDLQKEILERTRAEDQLQLLLNVTNQVVSNLQLQDLLRAISASVRRVMQCDLVSVCLPDSEMNRLQTFVLDFPESKGFIREAFFIPIEGSLSGLVIRTRKPWAGSASDILELGLKDEAAIPEGLKTGCILPLVSRNRILGVLSLARREENAFSQADIEFLGQVASQIAIAVENTFAYHQITQARGELEKALEEIQRLKDRLQDENLVLREQIDQALMFEEIVGASPALRAVLSRVSKVAPTDSTVLLTGETGTGKELIARAIHKRSRRSSRAFVSVSCAAIPPSLIASELFGHERGAFTGALQRRLGRFELAEEGTLFLDEVGELPAETQITLLRVLQEHEFQRVGGNQPIRANVRVIAATNRDLEAAIAASTFREDLFYRLNVFPIEIPPLRERREDIPLLVEYFIAHFARKAGKSFRGINKKTLDLLLSYTWPGNIRELQNVVERSVIVCETENFSVDESWLSRQSFASAPKSGLELSKKLSAQEREIIEAALRETGGQVSGPSGAAAKLGIHRSTLESKIASLKINKYRFKTANTSEK